MLLLAVEADAVGHGAYRVHIQAGVRLVQNGQARLQHQHLQYLGLLLLTTGEAHVQVAVGVALVHIQQGHGVLQLFLEVPQAQAAAGLLLQRRADEGAEGDAGDLQRVLEGQKNAASGTLVDGKLGDVLAVEQDAADGDGIGGAAGDGAAKGGLAGAVGAHQDVGLPCADGEVHAAEDLLALDAGVQVFYGKKRFLHVRCLLCTIYLLIYWGL